MTENKQRDARTPSDIFHSFLRLEEPEKDYILAQVRHLPKVQIAHLRDICGMRRNITQSQLNWKCNGEVWHQIMLREKANLTLVIEWLTDHLSN